MVAPRKYRQVFCTVIRVPATDNDVMVADNRFTTRPSNRLPWSDPTIAQLVANLQDEVRGERRQEKIDWLSGRSEQCDLNPPSPADDTDSTWMEEPRWSWPENE